jgi:hypothetical protein
VVYIHVDAKFLYSDTGLTEHETHLVRCFGNIISKHFDTQRSLLVSIPEGCDEKSTTITIVPASRTYCKVIDFLFCSIHSYQKYPLLVSGPVFNGSFKNISLAEKVDGFNIILCKGDDDMVFSAFKSELKRLSYLPFWNARGRFFVIFLDRNSAAVDTVPEEQPLIRNIFGELWKNDVVDAIVLTPTVNACKSSATTLDIHTWFPFAKDHCRGPVVRTVILDQCVMDGESQFDKNANLFPDKMLNFHGCVMTASTFPYFPFVFPMKERDSNITYYSDGLEINVLETIASVLNFKVKFLPETKHTVSKWYGLFDEVLRKESDLGFAAMPHTVSAVGNREHSVGYLKETIRWFGPHAKPSAHWKSLVIIFTPSMWFLVLIVYLISSLIFWLLANVKNTVKEHVSYTNMLMCYLQTFSIILGEAVCVRPNTWYLRLFFIPWVFYCLLVNTAYQSSLISVLTNPRFEPAVDTVDGLLNSGMSYGFVWRFHFWYNRTNDTMSNKILNNYTPCPKLDLCLKRIASKQDFVICGGESHLLYLSQTQYCVSGVPQFLPFKEEVASFFVTMFFRVGSVFLESFNKVIYRVTESGIVQKFWTDIKLNHIGHIDEDGDEGAEEDADGDGSDADVLTVHHLQGAFILLLLGLAFGISVFIIELIYFNLKKYRFSPCIKPSVSEFKIRSYVKYKRHTIHKTFVGHVKERNKIGVLVKVRNPS